MHLRSYITVAALAAVVFLAGCSGSGRLRFDTPQEAFERGQALYERGNYDRAVEALQAVFSFGRTHEWADDAQLYLARAHFGNKEYILAANEYSRFSEIYRTDPRREEAEYERALAYYELSPGYQLDQSNTEQAIQQFQLFVQSFPQSSYAPEAEERIRELRGKLAHKQFSAAELYARRELYEAAALSFESVFDRYPDTAWADDALLGAIRSWIAFAEQSIQARQVERLQEAVENYERMVQVFPESPHLSEARDLYGQAQARIEELTEPTSSLADQGGS